MSMLPLFRKLFETRKCKAAPGNSVLKNKYTRPDIIEGCLITSSK